MSAPRVYRLYISLYPKIMIFGVLGLFSVIGILMITGVLQSQDNGGPPVFFDVLWIGMVSFLWYMVLSLPHRIEVAENGEINFVSLIRQKRVKPYEIVSIKPEASQFGFLAVKYGGGKIRLLNQFDGFHEFITNLKAINPTIELRGC